MLAVLDNSAGVVIVGTWAGSNIDKKLDLCDLEKKKSPIKEARVKRVPKPVHTDTTEDVDDSKAELQALILNENAGRLAI